MAHGSGYNNARQKAVMSKAAWDEQRLGKRLTFLLRYGAVKEGISVSETGFVLLDELVQHNLIREYGREGTLQHIQQSTSIRGCKRFETRTDCGRIFVRAVYARNFQTNPHHEGSEVNTLLESCMQTICSNIHKFDLTDFPDEFLISSILHRLCRQNKLTNKVLRSLLASTMEHLDLAGVYLTEGTLKHVSRTCTQLRVLNLRGAGYLLNDTLLLQMLRKLPHLECLTLSGCKYLTDKALYSIAKCCPNIQKLNISMVWSLTEQGVADFITQCVKLEYLDIFDLRVTLGEQEQLVRLAKENGVTIVLKGVEGKTVTPENLTYCSITEK